MTTPAQEPNTRFRSSFTSVAGTIPSVTIQCKVVNVNVKDWTVDVLSQYDRYRFFGIQVATPYMHWNQGEGISVFPEVGAVCNVTLPSDSTAPFVSSFVMPLEVVGTASGDNPQGKSDATFSGGRIPAKPGDISIRTRDGNFVVLHRGGVLQIGATELAQSIYIPLQNMLMDVTQNYVHHNAGGSIIWALSDTTQTNIPSEYTHTFRIFADTKQADVRVKVGKVSDPLVEPTTGNQKDIDALDLGKEILYEVVVSPLSINAETGALESSARKNNVLRFFFDKKGGAFLRSQSSVAIIAKKKMLLEATEEIEIRSKVINFKSTGGATINGGSHTHIKGGVVRLGPGQQPVATMGSMIQVSLPYTPVPVPGSPPLILYGTVLTGSSTVLG